MRNIESTELLERIVNYVKETGCSGCNYFSDRLFMCLNKNSHECNRLNNFNGCDRHSKIKEFEKLLA